MTNDPACGNQRPTTNDNPNGVAALSPGLAQPWVGHVTYRRMPANPNGVSSMQDVQTSWIDQ